MTTFLDRIASSQAKSVLNRFGKTVTVKTKTTGTYNKDTGAVTATTATQTVKAQVDGQSLQTIGEMLQPGLVKRADLKVSIAASALTTVPTLGDAITIGSVDYAIHHIRPLYSGDDVALYEFTVAK